MSLTNTIKDVVRNIGRVTLSLGGIMEKSKVILVIASVMYFSCVWGKWNVVKIGQGPNWCYQLKVGKGRNDDTNRVYVSGYDGHVYEWTYLNGKWSYVDLGAGAQRMIALAIGDGRGDGVIRVYGANVDGYLYEFTYSSGNWIKSRLPNPQGSNASVTIGPGRNDRINRVYGSGWDTPIKEYTWTNTIWDRVDVSSSDLLIWPSSIGPGRNDGINRLYCPDWENPYVREYTLSSGSYSEALIDVSSSLCYAAIGEGRNDGVKRVYVSGKDAHIYELTYSEGNWQQVDICPSAPYVSRWGMCLGRIRNDGKIRVYSTATRRGGIREQSWNGSTWVDSLIDATTSASTDITIGPGRNDDTFRIYAGHIDGSVYEITHSSPWYGVEEKEVKSTQMVKIKGYPNPFTTYTMIRIHGLSGSENPVLRIYDITGKAVRTLPISNIASPVTVVWDTKDDYGNKVKPGVYFCDLKDSSIVDCRSEKLVVIK